MCAGPKTLLLFNTHSVSPLSYCDGRQNAWLKAKKQKNRKITSFCHSEFKLYILSIIIPHSETIIWLTHPHTHTLRREHECTHCTLTHSNKHFHVQTYMCTWNTQIQAQWPKQVCEQLQMKEQSSSGDLKRKERERLVFFLLHPDKKCPGLSSSLSK